MRRILAIAMVMAAIQGRRRRRRRRWDRQTSLTALQTWGGSTWTIGSSAGTQSFATFATDVPEHATLVLLGGRLVALAGIRQARRS
jgi:hypothetical protein